MITKTKWLCVTTFEYVTLCVTAFKLFHEILFKISQEIYIDFTMNMS